MVSKRQKLTFCFDVACPYAYLASQRMETLEMAAQKVAKDNNVQLQVEWKPVLLGGLYDKTNAPQGKQGSASDVMPFNKKALTGRDLRREAERWNVTLNWNPKHPIRTLNAMRLLCSIKDAHVKKQFSLDLYRAYWVERLDLKDMDVLTKLAASRGVHQVQERIESETSKDVLRENTDWLVNRGGFGVPSFFVQKPDGTELIYFGQDRMFFVALALGVSRAHKLGHPLRLLPIVKTSVKPTLKFYHDFSSPWSFLGSTQIHNLAQAHGARLELKPILVGALFREIGTPNLPLATMSQAKRAYFSRDMQYWCAFYGNLPLRFPDGFPIRTVLPLRVSIVEPKVVHVLYHAAWIEGLNIGEEVTLEKVLKKNGFNAAELLAKANSEIVKQTLRDNTKEAIEVGCCGVPTFQVNQQELVWGQDRLGVVSDMLASSGLSKTRSTL